MPVNFLNSASLAELISISGPAVDLGTAVAGALASGGFGVGAFVAGAFDLCVCAARSETAATWGVAIQPIMLIAKMAAPKTTRNDFFGVIWNSPFVQNPLRAGVGI